MPNHCECDLTVEGPAKTVAEFREFARGDRDFDFRKFADYPAEFAAADKAFKDWLENGRKGERPKDGYNNGGYDWCIEH